MENVDYTRAEEACTRTSTIIDNVEKAVFYWTSKKSKLDREWDRYIASRQDLLSQMPPEWPGMAKAQSAMAAVFCNSQNNKKFRKAMEPMLSYEEIRFCKDFEERPWRFSLFTVGERFGRDFYHVVDHLGGEEGLLKSPAITALLRSNKKCFFSLLLDNGQCLQTYGMVAYFNNLNAQDLAYFADQVDGGKKEEKSLADRIAEKPLPFLSLYAYAETPVLMHGKDAIRFCASEQEVPDPMDIVIPDEYLENGDEEVIAFQFGEDNFFGSQTFYLDLKCKKAVLISSTLGGYHGAVQILKPYIEMPEEPLLNLNPHIIVAAKELAGSGIPYEDYIDRFKEKSDSDSNEDLGPINQAMEALTEAYNNGRPVDMGEIARQYGVPENLLPGLQQQLDKMGKYLSIELPFAITGYIPPPPAVRIRMQGSFSENDLFQAVPSPKAQLLYQRGQSHRAILLMEYHEDPDLELKDFPDALDGIYETFWDLDDRIILNYTMRILSDQENAYREAREYACEVLRMFHQVLFSQTGSEDVHRFIRTYSRFLYLVLKPAGLIEADRDYQFAEIRSGTFQIRSTEFFQEWIRFK